VEKVVFHGVIGGATVSAAFLMVHLMARENISGYATHRDSKLLPEDIYDWNAFLALLDPRQGGPLASAVGVQLDQRKQLELPGKIDELRDLDFGLRNLREQIIGHDSWQQWESIPVIHLRDGTRRLWSVHFDRQPNNAWHYLRNWSYLRGRREAFSERLHQSGIR
jgi:hypothetical protein